MALVFDSLGYSRRLREAGMDAKVAEAAADAARDYIMLELVTGRELQAAIDGLRHDLEARMNNLELRLTVRLGSITVAAITAAVAVLALIIKLT